MDKQTGLLSKILVIGILILFIGLAVQPSVAVDPEKEIKGEHKDYLFQTILDIANNPEVKELLDKYKFNLFTFECIINLS